MKRNKIIFLILIASILAASLFLRLYMLDWETYGYGEVEIKEAAESYAKGNFVDNFYIFDTPPLSKYLFAAAAISGTSETGLRIVPLIFGMLTILATFLFARKLYGFNVGILSSALTGFSILSIQLSRYAQLETMLSFFFVAIAYFLWELLHENKKYTFLFLGASIGLAFATKFTSFIFLIAVLACAVYSRDIKASIRPNFALNINNKILKTIILAAIIFLAAWPFGFARLHTEANISVDYGTEVRTQQVNADIPIMLLSFSRRVFTSVGDSVEGMLSVPVLNYFLLYIVKESLLLIPLIAAGIYFIIRKPLKPDAMILIFLATFFVLLSFQRTSISYRHVVPAVPFLSIVASRWVVHAKRQWVLIAAISAILFAQAWLAPPTYALYLKPLKDTLGIPDSEFRFNEGMKETIAYLKGNCSKTYASDYYRVLAEPYYDQIYSTPPAQCVVKGNINDRFDVDTYIRDNNCGLSKTISKNSVKLIEIYKC